MTTYENAVTELNFTFDLNEFWDYYNTVKTQYDSQKWTWEENIDHIDQSAIDLCVEEAHRIMYSWPLQSNMADPSIPPQTVRSKHDEVPYYNTDLMFGFAKKLYEKMPFTYRWVLFVMPPGGKVIKHSDDDEFVIHIPLQWEPETLFIFGDAPNTKAFCCTPNGKAYLGDVSIPHETINNSTKERIGLICRLRRADLDKLLAVTGTI